MTDSIENLSTIEYITSIITIGVAFLGLVQMYIYGGKKMKTDIKVAGTTFHPLPQGVGLRINNEAMEDNVPIAYTRAVLIPEPTNKYDPEAVQVIIELKTGEAFVIGYIPKDEPIKTQIKRPTMALLCIKDYTQVGNLNPSFVIKSIEMGVK